MDELWRQAFDSSEEGETVSHRFAALLFAEPAPVQPVAWVDLLKQAEEVVRSKPLWKKYIDGTPLANDIAVWMASFAQEHTTPPAQPAPESGSWYAASDIDNMVRDLDVAMNGDGAAPQAKLCDLMPQFIQRLTKPAPIPDAITDNSESPEYMAGWNDCRAEMLRMRSSI
jgi:hypothetical protein